MRCEEVQDQASAWLDGELSQGRAALVAEHVAGCVACQDYVDDLRHLSALTREAARQTAPSGLEDRVRAALAEEDGAAVIPFPPRTATRWRGFVQQVASMAAVCLLSVFGTWAVLRQPAPAPSVEHDVVAAHVRSLLQDSTIQVASSDQHTVRPWFNGKVEFAPPVKDLTSDGFPLVGGRLDFVDGHRVATLVYRHGPHTVSVFVWPEAAGAAPPGKLEQRDGLNVLSWAKDGMIWWAVSDMEAGELRELRTLL